MIFREPDFERRHSRFRQLHLPASMRPIRLIGAPKWMPTNLLHETKGDQPVSRGAMHPYFEVTADFQKWMLSTLPFTFRVAYSCYGAARRADGTRNMANTIVISGKMSVFGGPHDLGVQPDEGLALVEPAEIGLFPGIFLPQQPPGTTGLARRLDPDAYYIACRWDEHGLARSYLQQIEVTVTNSANGKSDRARPVDAGPNVNTGRVADLSPGLATKLGLATDNECTVMLAPA